MKVLVIQGSPDAGSFSCELSTAYADEARNVGHDVRVIDLAREQFDPVLRYGYRLHMEDESAPHRYQEDIAWADHIVFSFPIWWSAEPAVLKGFLDRTLTPRFAYRYVDGKQQPLLVGKTAALIVTSRVPSFVYRFFGGPITRWKHMVLKFVGIRLTKTLMLGRIEHDEDTPAYRDAFVEKVRAYARA